MTSNNEETLRPVDSAATDGTEFSALVQNGMPGKPVEDAEVVLDMDSLEMEMMEHQLELELEALQANQPDVSAAPATEVAAPAEASPAPATEDDVEEEAPIRISPSWLSPDDLPTCTDAEKMAAFRTMGFALAAKPVLNAPWAASRVTGSYSPSDVTKTMSLISGQRDKPVLDTAWANPSAVGSYSPVDMSTAMRLISGWGMGRQVLPARTRPVDEVISRSSVEDLNRTIFQRMNA